MTEIEWLEEVGDEKVKNLIWQFHKIVSIIKDECDKNGITFVNVWYFRKWDNLKEITMNTYFTCTSVDTYDEFILTREFKRRMDGWDEE